MKTPLIKKILMTRTKVYLGESFRVSVKTSDDDPRHPVHVSINQAVGSDQYLQFADYCGRRKVTVLAYTDDKRTERRDVEIDVLDPAPCMKYPIIDVTKDYSGQYHVRCSIRNAEPLRLGRVFYEWQIGKVITHSEIPSTTFSLDESLDPTLLYQTFDVLLTIHLPDESTIRAQRSFTFWNDYAYCKRVKRTILPPVAYDFVATRHDASVRATCTVRNLEDVSLFLTSRQLEFLYNDPEALSRPGPNHPIETIVIEPHARSAVDCGIPLANIPSDAWGFAMHYHGHTDDKYEVHVSAYFEYVTNHKLLKKVIHPKLALVLNGLRVDTCRQARNTFTVDEVEHFLRAQALSIDRLPAPRVSTYARELEPAQILTVRNEQVSIMDALQSAFMYETRNEGDECLPDQESPTEDFACQLTDEWAWVYVPSRIMNARKGDVILSPSGLTGPVSLVLHHVTPPQNYAHTGIMVQNFYALRHSSGCDDWLQDEDYLRGTAITGAKGTDGLDPDRLKYLWPGPYTQSAHEALAGTWLPDPDGHKDDKGNVKLWRIAAFDFYAKDNGNNTIVEPLVVKPPAMIEAALPQVRTLLHRVADESKKINGHYRFYCYTDAAISLDPKFNAPSRPGWWASGTVPTMCSNFIWLSVQAVTNPTIHLEGPQRITRDSDLEQADVAPAVGAAVDRKTLDGLYFYDEAERRNAAQALYKEYYDIANAKTWWRFGNDAPDDVASQICNTFASDWSGENADGDDAKDSDDWENPGDGRSVSPANILLWDAPRMEGDQLMGLYGATEKVVYRPARLEWRQVSRWKKVEHNGRLTGHVVRRGGAQAGAFVTAGGQEALTDAQGAFALTVRAGRYSVESRIFADNFMWEGNAPVDVPAGGTADVLVVLKEPSDWFREVIISGTMNLKDEENFGDDEFATRTRLFRLFRIGAFYTHEEDGWTEKMGGEVRAELSIKLDWQMIDSSVNVACTLKLFEGTSEETGDLDGEGFQIFNIKKDVIDQECRMFVRNDDEDDDDHVDLTLKISNRRQP
jgi:hypothetical protein